MKRIFLSPPWTGEEERAAVEAAFDSGWIAPCGPVVEAFERRLAELSGRRFAVAVSSGTAAIDLVMEHLGVDSSWTVVAPTLTFMATVGPAAHRRATLVFVDCGPDGSVDCARLDEALAWAAGETPGKVAFVCVDLYGRCCDYAAVEEACARRGAVLVCDSAEAVGAVSAGGRPAGSAGVAGIYSFNGNKIVTTSGGGAVLVDSPEFAAHVRSLSQQSREPRPWYEHREVGYNYRMSSLLAAVGMAQLAKLPEILRRRAANRRRYGRVLSAAGIPMLPPVAGENNWLSVALLPGRAERDALIAAFDGAGIDSRPVWKPMHLQPVFRGCRTFGGRTAERLFRRGVCLPSGSGLSSADWRRIESAVSRFAHKQG